MLHHQTSHIPNPMMNTINPTFKLNQVHSYHHPTPHTLPLHPSRILNPHTTSIRYIVTTNQHPMTNTINPKYNLNHVQSYYQPTIYTPNLITDTINSKYDLSQVHSYQQPTSLTSHPTSNTINPTLNLNQVHSYHRCHRPNPSPRTSHIRHNVMGLLTPICSVSTNGESSERWWQPSYGVAEVRKGLRSGLGYKGLWGC